MLRNQRAVSHTEAERERERHTKVISIPASEHSTCTSAELKKKALAL